MYDSTHREEEEEEAEADEATIPGSASNTDEIDA